MTRPGEPAAPRPADATRPPRAAAPEPPAAGAPTLPDRPAAGTSTRPDHPAADAATRPDHPAGRPDVDVSPDRAGDGAGSAALLDAGGWAEAAGGRPDAGRHAAWGERDRKRGGGPFAGAGHHRRPRPDADEPEPAPPPPTGWRRLLQPRVSPGILALILAVGATGALLLGPKLRERDSGAPVPLAAAWPRAAVGTLAAHLPDGPSYDPVLLLDGGGSVGTAATPDGRAQRLVHLDPAGAVRTLRTLSFDADPLFGGVGLAGDRLVWAETVSGPGGAAASSLWSAPLRGAGPPARLTARTGALAFFHSQYDLVHAEDKLRWIAVGTGATPVSELRSMPLSGGAVEVRPLAGQWAMSRWPWLVSVASAGSGGAQRYDLATNRQLDVPSDAVDLVTCGPTWCRVQVLGDAGPSQLDVMRPDGRERRRIAGPGTSAAITDVGVLDRFEVLSRAVTAGAADSQQELVLYDIARRRTVVVAQGVNLVNCRDGRLWWSTGSAETTRWHTLDLRTLH
ncbi:hypothetical protein GCM10010123_21860 [Pilimelia anulata]|uniref:Uncharacterized protein n=1 Tax=Pilimelia anulata TaxID=53371 RepID=A0A8J3F901_9ACTN|nr:hypothetical protein [Pilimelia anulata]GGJ91692.1 hypothetical protein GCM10010123_21860 [Pilimelia anulata]